MNTRERLLKRVSEARAEFEGQLEELDSARDFYYQTIRQLHADGMSLRQIATELGMSHQRVHQIVEGNETRKRQSWRGLGAAGVVVALALASAALYESVGKESPAPAEPQASIRLVNEAPITLNDVRDIKRFQKSIASGTIGTKHWSVQVAYAHGIYCAGLVFVPGPPRQGKSCGNLPSNQSSDPIGETVFQPAGVTHPLAPSPFIYGRVSSDVASIRALPCDGWDVRANLYPVPDARLQFFVAFLPRGTTGVGLVARDSRNRVLVDHQSRCSSRLPGSLTIGGVQGARVARGRSSSRP